MEQETIIADLEARAKEAGFTMRQICERAEVWPGTVSRWKVSKSGRKPIWLTFTTLSKLNDALADLSKAKAA